MANTKRSSKGKRKKVKGKRKKQEKQAIYSGDPVLLLRDLGLK
jgi:hypothetical protein